MSFRVVGYVFILAALAGCSSSSGEQPAVSPDLVESVRQFQAANGLFYMPESLSHRSEPSIATTANYMDLAPEWSERQLDLEQMAEVQVGDPAAMDIGNLQAALTLMVKAGAGSNNLELDAGLLASVAPQPSQDLGSEVAAVWLWSSAAASAGELTGDDLFGDALVERFDAIDIDESAEHPFLVYRLAQVDRLLSGQVSPEIGNFVSAMVEEPLPLPRSTNSVLDALAIQRLRNEQGLDTGLSDTFLDELAAFSVAPDFVSDDLALAATLGLLANSDVAAGGDGLEADLSASIVARIDEETGLLTPASRSVPTVEATFAFARVMEKSFSEVASEKTIEALLVQQSNASVPLPTRLQATYALREAGYEQWEDGLDVEQTKTEVAAATPQQLDAESLPNYLSIMSSAGHLYPDLPKKDLTEFSTDGDPQRELLAASAIRSSYLFANEVDVRSMFSHLQETLGGVALDENAPFAVRLRAISTLAAAGYEIDQASTYFDIGTELALQRECEGGLSLYSIDGQKGSPCSLVLTLEAKSIPEALR